jgi:hypothetical protein
VAFSRPDGKTLAAGYAHSSGRSGGVVLFEAGSGKLLPDQPPAVAEGGVNSVAFSPNGKTLAAGFGKGVMLHSTNPNSWIELAQQIANRNLTWAEWREYFPDRSEYHRTFKCLPDPPDLPRAVAPKP